MVVGVVALGAVGLIEAAPASERWGPFQEQVVDLETGQPIPGAVLAVWWKVVPNLVAGTQEFYAAREAITGPDGRFEIPRLSVPPWQLGVQPGQVTLFAPGDKWEATVVTPPDGQEFVDSTVAQMRRLKTPEEHRKASWHLPPGGVPHEKMPNLLKALNRQLSGKETEPYSLGGTR